MRSRRVLVPTAEYPGNMDDSPKYGLTRSLENQTLNLSITGRGIRLLQGHKATFAYRASSCLQIVFLCLYCAY